VHTPPPFFIEHKGNPRKRGPNKCTPPGAQKIVPISVHPNKWAFIWGVSLKQGMSAVCGTVPRRRCAPDALRCASGAPFSFALDSRFKPPPPNMLWLQMSCMHGQWIAPCAPCTAGRSFTKKKSRLQAKCRKKKTGARARRKFFDR
jgi:hypothetical protein